MNFIRERKKLLIIVLLILTAIAIPLTLYLQQQQQDIRQHAASSATLSFTPSTTSSNPLQVTVNNTFTLDMQVNPGSNAVSIVTYQIQYDSTKMTPDTTTPFVLNTAAFPQTLEGPIYTAGKISGTVSIGATSDPSKAITAITKIATVKFKAIATTSSPTTVSYTALSQLLSVSSQDQASENVLSSQTPAYVMINPLGCSNPVNGSGGSGTAGPGVSVKGGDGGTGKSGPNGECIPGTNGYSVNASNYCSTKAVAISWPTTNTATYYKLTIDGTQVYNGTGQSFSASNYSSGTQHNISLYAGNTTFGDFNPSTGGYFTISTSACPTPTPTSTPSPTPTLTPTPLPPTLTLSANPTTVTINGDSTLTWTSSNTSSCTASGGWSGIKPINGTALTGSLTQTTTFTLSCTGPGGSVTKSVTVTVVAPTPTPTRTPTPTPTPIPTNTPVPTNTPIPQATKFNVAVFLHGIGHSGDNANPTAYSLSNQNPVHSQRTLTVEVIDNSGNTILTKSGLVTYNATNGNFTGTIDMGTTLQSAVYNIKFKSHQYLKKQITGIQTVTAGQTLTLPDTTLVTGDVNDDNKLNILDYDIIVGCYSDFAPAVSCSGTGAIDADLTDDGHVNQFDYNLFLRDLSVQNGD